MTEMTCPGLPADWLNGWLAALGAIARVPELLLRWSDDPVPLAVLVAPSGDDPAHLLAEAWPTEDEIATLPIARHLPGQPELNLNPDVATWATRASLARIDPQGWTLSSLYTDLKWDRGIRTHSVGRGHLHTGAPTGRTMHQRLQDVVSLTSLDMVAPALHGAGTRVEANGLGFDLTRLPSSGDNVKKKWVDPVTEVLAFFGLSSLPTRGDPDSSRVRQRLHDPPRQPFCWISWHPALDKCGVDALLDISSDRVVRRTVVTGVWETVEYPVENSMDPTRGYGSRRVAGP
ncbi:MAG: hypothetical protein ACR2JF_15410 [Iamia sp.]